MNLLQFIVRRLRGLLAKLTISYIFLAPTAQALTAGESSIDQGLPIEALYGAYEILGKTPGENGGNYRAWVRIAVEERTLVLDRCFEGERTEGSGRLITVGADHMPAVRFEFFHGKEMLEATCHYHSDFDNLPRFTCYTYPHGNARIETPGLEAYFPIIWPVPIDYFDCR